MRNPKNTLLLSLVLLIASCAAVVPDPAEEPARVDRIVIRFSPSGDVRSDDVQVYEVHDEAVIDSWIEALEAIPEPPDVDVRLVNFRLPVPEHEITFCAGDEVVDTRRMKAGQLDVKAHAGWAFYSGEDREFVNLLSQVVPLR